MPNYSIYCKDLNNNDVILIYNNIHNKLTQNGKLLFDHIESQNNSIDHYESIRIVLGTKCNYNCSYCSQKKYSNIECSVKDADMFLENLDKWCDKPPKRIEFWGGEPLVYFKFLQRLVPELRKRFPADQTVFTIVSNGSLLTDEIGDFFSKHLILYSISYDSYGQTESRGKDILESQEMCDIIVRNFKKINNSFKDFYQNIQLPMRCRFCVVLSNSVLDPYKAVKYIQDKLNYDVPVQVMPLLGMGNDVIMSNDKLNDITTNIIRIAFKRKKFPINFHLHFQEFENIIKAQKTNDEGFAFCSIGRSSSIVVDLKGNLYPCQNKLNEFSVIGNVNNEIVVPPKINSIKRKTCTYCPCLGICRGGCPLAFGNELVETCRNKFAFCIGILASFLIYKLDLFPYKITGPIVRPKRELVTTKDGSNEIISEYIFPKYYED